jgi:hypothetical protein
MKDWPYGVSSVHTRSEDLRLPTQIRKRHTEKHCTGHSVKELGKRLVWFVRGWSTLELTRRLERPCETTDAHEVLGCKFFCGSRAFASGMISIRLDIYVRIGHHTASPNEAQRRGRSRSRPTPGRRCSCRRGLAAMKRSPLKRWSNARKHVCGLCHVLCHYYQKQLVMHDGYVRRRQQWAGHACNPNHSVYVQMSRRGITIPNVQRTQRDHAEKTRGTEINHTHRQDADADREARGLCGGELLCGKYVEALGLARRAC